MEVSGRKHSKDTKATDTNFQLYCEPCDGDGERIKAGGYCKECREYLCKPCIKQHRRYKQSKMHEIMEGDNLPTTRPQTGHDDLSMAEICPVHKETRETIKFYCPTHNDIGCGDCIVLTHRTCKVDYIADASKGFKDSREFKDLLASISTLEQLINDCEDAIKDTSKSNTEVQQTALESIRNYKAEILAYFDKREQDIVKEIEAMKSNDDTKLADIRTQNEESKRKLEEIKREIENNRDDAKKLFISAKQRKSDLKKLEKCLAESTNEVKASRRLYKFSRDAAFEEIMTSKSPLGTLGNGKILTTLNLAKARCIPSNDIDIRTNEDNANCCITGMGFLRPDVLVLADRKNGAVKLVDTKAKKVISCLQLFFQPYDITILPDEQIAVTTYNDQKIHILSARNNKLSTLRQFKVSGECRGIDYNLGKLAVIYFRPNKVEIMDTNGVVTSVINSDKTNKIRGPEGYVMFASTGLEVLVTCEENRVKKLSLQGDVLASYSDADLRYPSGIAETGAGGMLVCGMDSHTVHVVCEDDKKMKTLLSSKDGLHYPRSLYVSEEAGMMYVGSQGKDVLKTFKLQQ